MNQPTEFPQQSQQLPGEEWKMNPEPEVGPAYVFLGSMDSSYMTGQILHINGGEIVGG